jgi:hypothetical protein
MAFEEFLTKMKDFGRSDFLPVALGMGAQAAMGPHQNEWQALLGRGVMDLQRSNIAAKAAQRQAVERNTLNSYISKLLSGQGLTPQGTQGPTAFNLKTSPEGEQTITVKGDQLMPGGPGGNVDPRSGLGGATRPSGGGIDPRGIVGGQGRGTAQGISPPFAPGADPRALPFILAQGVRSSAGATGGSANFPALAGLTPEQIASVTRQDIAGGALTQKSVSDIFTNMQRQALSDYYGRLPQTAGTKTPMSFTGMQINNKTGNWAYFDRVQNKRVDTGIKATEEELGALKGDGPKEFAPNWREAEYIKNKTRRRGLFKNGRLVTDLGEIAESTVESGRAFGIDKDLAEIEARIESDDYVQSDLDNFNKKSEGSYFYKAGKGFLGGKEAEKVPLPPGVTAADMYETLRVNPTLKVEDVIRILTGKR